MFRKCSFYGTFFRQNSGGKLLNQKCEFYMRLLDFMEKVTKVLNLRVQMFKKSKYFKIKFTSLSLLHS